MKKSKFTETQIVKAIKDAKVKVQASIQADQVRVVGRSKDDLQKAMAIALTVLDDQGNPTTAPKAE